MSAERTAPKQRRTRGEVPRRRLSSRVIGSLVTAASNRSRKRSSMACRTRAITKFRCHPRVAHRCRIPTSPPWPPMSGLSAIAEDKVAITLADELSSTGVAAQSIALPCAVFFFTRGPSALQADPRITLRNCRA
jgi:hypothetical protein